MNKLQKQEAGMLARMIQQLDRYQNEAETYGAMYLLGSLIDTREMAQDRLLRVVNADPQDDGMSIAEKLDAADICAVVWTDSDPIFVEIKGLY